MASTWPHTAAILAGGRSSRMGRPKHLMRLPDGRTLLETVIDALRPHVARIVIAAGPCTEQLSADLAMVADLRRDQGPLGGIEAVLASGVDGQYLFCPCDVPLIDTEIIAVLTKESIAKATVLQVEGEARPRPLPARISSRALDDVQAMLDSGRRAVHALIAHLDPEVVPVRPAVAHALLNINDADDFKRACARWRNGNDGQERSGR